MLKLKIRQWVALVIIAITNVMSFLGVFSAIIPYQINISYVWLKPACLIFWIASTGLLILWSFMVLFFYAIENGTEK